MILISENLIDWNWLNFFTRLKMWIMCVNTYINEKSEKLAYFTRVFYFWQMKLNLLSFIWLFHQIKTFSSENSSYMSCSVDYLIYQVIIFVDIDSGCSNLSLQVFTWFWAQFVESLERWSICFSRSLLFKGFFCWTFFWWISAKRIIMKEIHRKSRTLHSDVFSH